MFALRQGNGISILYQIKSKMGDQEGCTCSLYQRKAIRGFQWLSKDQQWSSTGFNNTNFKNFKIFDEKKKWKKQKHKTFEGLGQRIEKVIRSDPRLKEKNLKKGKEEIFKAKIEEIHIRNQFNKIKKIEGVHRICERQKNLKNSTIDEFFQKEIDWVNKNFQKYEVNQSPDL